MSHASQPKPSFLEAGLPVASLSAECQRDNNARQRPPQNRLHIWWARRPPTVCRAAILAALLPYDLYLPEEVLPLAAPELSETDLDNLPSKYRPHREFFERLLADVPPTPLTPAHEAFLRALGIMGDAARAYQRMAYRETYHVNGNPILLPMEWTYRHQRAFAATPGSDLVAYVLSEVRDLLGLQPDEPVVLLDSMAGGGAIPLEGVRYGLKTYANELNPVAALILKATLEYPARFGRALAPPFAKYINEIDERVRQRLLPFFYVEPAGVWWSEEATRATREFSSKQIVDRRPARLDSSKNCSFWLRTVLCSNCGLNIPLSTNFYIVKKKGQAHRDLAVFPVVPPRGAGDDCTFRIVPRAEWPHCRWPRFTAGEHFHPTETPTYKGGSAICPRCSHVMDGEEIKAIARARTERGEGAGLATQLYAVAAQVPVQLTYRNGDVKVRWLWRFRALTQADLDAIAAAEAELARLRPGWEAQDLIPTEEIPPDIEDTRPIEYGMPRWRHLFLPRQLLTNVTVLEEIRAAQARARAELPPEQAEAVGVYLSFVLSKIVNYNSVNTFWHYGRLTVAQTFSRHDFAFRPAFCEFEGARETVMWGASQVVSAYEALAGLIHGEPVSLEGGEDDEEVGAEDADGAGDDADLAGEEESEEDEDQEDAQAGAALLPVPGEAHLRPEVIVPTITNEDAAALAEPAPGTVHLICVDPPYYKNVQYAELSNFFYVWLKRALRDEPGLAPLFREPLAETNREAVANAARWQTEAEREQAAWAAAYERAFEQARAQGSKVRQAKAIAAEVAGPKPLTAAQRADRFYEDKMADVFRRARRLLHPRGRMVVMFNHKETKAWRNLGMALIRAGFEVRSSVPIHTEAESSLNIRGLDAARSTILLFCRPRVETQQPVGNWAPVQEAIRRTATGAAQRFRAQGLAGTDLYLSALGPALAVVGRNWPVTTFGGQEIDLEEALEEAYNAVGLWRLDQILGDLTARAGFADLGYGFNAQSVDRSTQVLWLWLDTFQGAIAHSNDVQKLAKSLNVDPREFRAMGLITVEKEQFVLSAPQEMDMKRLARRLQGEELRGREARLADRWEQRTFPEFLGAAVWNGIALMIGTEDGRGPETLKRWVYESGYARQPDFKGAFAVTLMLLEQAFARAPEGAPWGAALHEARRAWDLVVKDLRV